MTRTHLSRLAAVAVTGLLVAGVAAYGAWSVSGSGTGSASAATATNLTLTPGTPATALYPNGSADVATTIANDNPFPVHVIERRARHRAGHERLLGRRRPQRLRPEHALVRGADQRRLRLGHRGERHPRRGRDGRRVDERCRRRRLPGRVLHAVPDRDRREQLGATPCCRPASGAWPAPDPSPSSPRFS